VSLDCLCVCVCVCVFVKFEVVVVVVVGRLFHALDAGKTALPLPSPPFSRACVSPLVRTFILSLVNLVQLLLILFCLAQGSKSSI
jgi:hypothetical protein